MNKFAINTIGATWWPNFSINARIVKEFIKVIEVKIVKELKTVKEVNIVKEVKIVNNKKVT